MWRGHACGLYDYVRVMAEVWLERRPHNRPHGAWVNLQADHPGCAGGTPPGWVGLASFHASHRANLLRKEPEHYGQFGWTEDPSLPYVWPIP